MRIPYVFLSFCLCGTEVLLAEDKPASAAPKSHTARESSDDSGRHAASETAAAIEALGEHPTNRQIAAIIFKAVRSSPANVQFIVHAAVRVSPQSAAPAIVTAATAAVPDPWKQVSYRRIIARQGKKGASEFKGGPDGDQIVNLGGNTPGHTSSSDRRGPDRGAGGASNGDPSNGGTPGGTLTLTLAEAIARTAFDAQPGLSFPDLQSAVDVALNTDPATLLRYVQSSRSISGVGDAGSSNFANEPLSSKVLSNRNAVPAPNPPVVSR